jgi:hypothetical protein
MRRLVAAVAGLIVVGLVIGGVSLASSGPANRNNPLVLDLITRATAINNFVDTGPPGFSTGDLYVFSDRVFAASAPAQQIGTVDGRCVLIDPATLRYDCSTTGHLADGDIMTAGNITLAQGTTSTLAVVGGTGAYAVARGDATLELGPFEGPHNVTIRLVLNP